MSKVDVGGLELAYEVAGAPGAPPMVLLHGLGGRASGWNTVTPALATRFRVYAFDARGHGDSDWPGEYSFALMAADMTAALDNLGLSEVTLVGHSMGGSVAWRIAIARPDLVRRLIIEDAPPPVAREPRPLPDQPSEPIDFDWAVVTAIRAEVDAGDPETWSRLESVKAPTLLIAGGPDSHVPQDTFAEAARLIPRCELVTIPVGHRVHHDSPDRFTETVLGWVSAG